MTKYSMSCLERDNVFHHTKEMLARMDLRSYLLKYYECN